MKQISKILLLLASVLLALAGCTGGDSADKVSNKEIIFADVDWDSIKFHNAVVGTIANELWGYEWKEIQGSTPITQEALMQGEIDVHMEIWSDNLTSYDEDLAAGRFKELGVNFDDNYQGIYVPRYVIEGDAERNIKAVAPDLKYIWELKNYPDVFKDDENPEKGRIYGAIPGWEVDEILYNKYLHYKLDENFVYFRPGSSAALASVITRAYEKGEAIAAYYWEPTWLLGQLDMVLLEDEPYDANTYKDGKTALPAVRVTIGISNKFAEEGNEELIELLKKYRTSSKLTSKALAYMQETNSDYVKTAKWFLQENTELIDSWLNTSDAKKIKEFLSK